jgi:hypothetical protein
MMPKPNKRIMATILLEAAYTSDTRACERYGISDRTLRNYRRRLAEGGDAELAAFFRDGKAALDRQWAEALPGALRQGIDCIGECARAVASDEYRRKDPLTISAVARAVKICAEVFYAGRVIDARLASLGAERLPDDEPTGDGLWTN